MTENDTITVEIYGHASTSVEIDAEEWDSMTREERMDFAQDNFKNVRPQGAEDYEWNDPREQI